MSTSATRKRPGQAQNGTLPSYAAGCYAIPIRFLYGTAAENNFWDVVYFRAHETGGAFDTSTRELVRQMGLSRQVIGCLRHEAVERGELVEDVSWVSGRRFVLRVRDFNRLTKGIIWKPLGYVRNGWHRMVTPAIPKRVLNLYLQQPRQRAYRLDPRYIAAKCKRRFPYGDYRPVAPLNLADVGKALRLLVRLGLLVPEGDGFRIDWATFNQPAPAAGPPFDAPDPRQHPLFRQAAITDPDRAERALELLDVGHYRLETHFSAIFRDLAYVRSEDYPLLKAKAYRHRNRPPGPRRWRTTWKAFQYELRRRVAEVRGPKRILSIGETTSAASPLALDFDQVTGHVLAVRLVSRVEWPWYLETRPPAPAESQTGQAHGQPDDIRAGGSRTPTVRLELRSGDRVFFARQTHPGDAEVRYTLHPDEWPTSAALLTLTAQSNQPLHGVHVEAWLEARLRR